ncbi:unnamed protein product [Durusdinium trenchii]|uniref:Uncharacterized protein n=1 Tax=Durusdinium trenchii TaxID=1381693 RepID=A0ABP0PJK0_9DINO
MPLAERQGELLAEDELALHGMHDAYNDPMAIDEAAGEYRRRHQIRERARQNNGTVYVGMRTRLWRCSREQLRAALPSELLGRDLISNPELGELLRQVVSGTHAGTVDVSREGPPTGEEAYGPVQREEEGIPLGHPVEVSSARGPGASDQSEHSGPSSNESGQSQWIPPGLIPNITPAPRQQLPPVPEDEDLDLQDSLQYRPDDSQSMNQPRSLQLWHRQKTMTSMSYSAKFLPTPAQAQRSFRSPPSKVARTDSLEETHTRAPGTPVDRLLSRIPRELSPEHHPAAASSSLTPAEDLGSDGRVSRQVSEFENLRQNYYCRNVIPEDHDHQEWSGSFFNYQLGDQILTVSSEGSWNFMAKRNDEISLKDLTAEERVLFDESDDVEWTAVEKTGTIKVLMGKEANDMRKKYPDRILSSRMVRRKKPQPELHSWKAKRALIQIVVPVYGLDDVDDFIVAATPAHYEALRKSMTERFHFGKWEKGEEEFQALRSLVFKINWVGRESRPEAAGIASLMASRLPRATIGDVIIVNRFVNFLRSTAERPMKIWRFHPEEMCFIAVSDAGGINMQGTDLVDAEGLPMDATQGAWMVLTAGALPQGKAAVRASPITWRSSRLKRKVFSTFGGETQAMLQGVNEVDWLQELFEPTHAGDAGAKSLFDCLLRENPSGKQDRKSALELAIILKDLQETRSMVRWVPHQKMLVDSLTKLDPLKANDALHQFLRSGWLSLVDVQEELTCRKTDPAYK